MKTTKNPWSDYWQKGAKASFLDDKARLQAYQMRKFWFERMEENELKQPIVDVGTAKWYCRSMVNGIFARKRKKARCAGNRLS